MIQGQINGGVFLGRSVLGGLSLPNKAINPNPANLATGVNPIGTVLSWTDGGGGTLSYNVWIDGVFQGNQVGTSFDPGVLLGTHAYTWRIDSVNGAGTTTGDVWTFNTMALFDYTPNTEIFNWTDSGGAHAGTLAQFYASPDFATTTRVDFLGNANILTITGVQSLVHLDYLNASYTSIPSLDVSGSPALTFVTATESYTCLDFLADHCPLLDTVFFEFPLPMFANIVDLSSCPNLRNAHCSGANPFVGMFCADDSSLLVVEAGFSDQLTVLDLTNCFAIQSFHLEFDSAMDSVDVTPLLALVQFGAALSNLASGIGSMDFHPVLDSVTIQTSNIPELHAANTPITTCLAYDDPLLTYVDLTNSPDLTYFKVSNCLSLTEIDGFATCPSLNFLDFSGCSSLTAVEPLTTASSVVTVYGTGCPITSFSLSSDQAFDIEFFECNLDTASVDAILAGCDLPLGLSGGTLFLDGGGNSSPTGGPLNPNYVDLTSLKMWIVNIN